MLGTMDPMASQQDSEAFQRTVERAVLGRRRMPDLGSGLFPFWDFETHQGEDQELLDSRRLLIDEMVEEFRTHLNLIVREWGELQGRDIPEKGANLRKLYDADKSQVCPNNECRERNWIAPVSPLSKLKCTECEQIYRRFEDDAEYFHRTARICVRSLLTACSPRKIRKGTHFIHAVRDDSEGLMFKVPFSVANRHHRRLERLGGDGYPFEFKIREGCWDSRGRIRKINKAACELTSDCTWGLMLDLDDESTKVGGTLSVKRVTFDEDFSILPVRLVSKIAARLQDFLLDEQRVALAGKSEEETEHESEWIALLNLATNLVLALIDCNLAKMVKLGVKAEDQYSTAENRLALGTRSNELINRLPNHIQSALFEMLKEDSRTVMVCPPLDHELDENGIPIPGGFLEKQLNRRSGTISNHHVHEKNCRPRLRLSDTAINAVNHLQRTEWTVDAWMVDIASMAFDEYVENIHESSSELEQLDEPDAAKRARKRMEDTYDSLASQMKLAESLVSEKFVNSLGNRFWHPWQFDWRGRLYTVSSHLNPQGSDVSKSLIRFADEYPLTQSGLYWLKVHVGGLWWFGNIREDEAVRAVVFQEEEPESKLTFEQRCRLADVLLENGTLHQIVSGVDSAIESWRLGERPDVIEKRWIEDESRIFTKKVEDFQRLAAARELVRIEDQLQSGKSTEEVMCGLPIVQDASCNIYQHASALMRDRQLAERVNVITSPEGIGDIYLDVAHKVKELWEEEGVSHALVSEFASKQDELATRSVAKGPVMVTGYGSSSGHLSFMSHNRESDGNPGLQFDVPLFVSLAEDGHYQCAVDGCDYKASSKIHSRGFQQVKIHHYVEHLAFPAQLCPECKNDSNRRNTIQNVKQPDGTMHEKSIPCPRCEYEEKGRGYIQDGLDPRAFVSLKPHLVKVLKDGSASCPESTSNIRDKSTCKRFSRSVGGKSTTIPQTVEVIERHLARKHPRRIFHDVSTLARAKLKVERDGVVTTVPNDEQEAWAIQLMADYKIALESVAGGFEQFRTLLQGMVKNLWKAKKEPVLTWSTASGTTVSNLYYKRKKEQTPNSRWKPFEQKKDALKAQIDAIAREEIDPRQDKDSLRRVMFEELNLKVKRYEPDTKKPSVEPGVLQLYADEGVEFACLCVEYIQATSMITLQLDSEQIDYKKSLSGIGPNFIHSLDAAHMALVVNEMAALEQINPAARDFWAVHDAYGCHPSVMEDLRRIILEKFVEVHQDNTLANLVNEMSGMEMTLGELEINDVLNSAYLIS